jgi:hypothetical protein
MWHSESGQRARSACSEAHAFVDSELNIWPNLRECPLGLVAGIHSHHAFVRRAPEAIGIGTYRHRFSKAT